MPANEKEWYVIAVEILSKRMKRFKKLFSKKMDRVLNRFQWDH